MLPMGTNTFGLYLDKTGPEKTSGWITGGGLQEASPFSSLTKMILLVDELLDREPENGERALLPGQPDFELEVLFRQNYSWQGRLRWLAGGKEATFRSCGRDDPADGDQGTGGCCGCPHLELQR